MRPNSTMTFPNLILADFTRFSKFAAGNTTSGDYSVDKFLKRTKLISKNGNNRPLRHENGTRNFRSQDPASRQKSNIAISSRCPVNRKLQHGFFPTAGWRMFQARLFRSCSSAQFHSTCFCLHLRSRSFSSASHLQVLTAFPFDSKQQKKYLIIWDVDENDTGESESVRKSTAAKSDPIRTFAGEDFRYEETFER